MIALVVLYLIQTCLCQAQNTEVKYLLNFDSQMDCCDDASTKAVDVSNVVVDLYNDSTAFMYGEIEFFEEIGDDTVVELILEKEASGKYEVVFNHLICNLCEEISKGAESDYHRYMKYFGIPSECPFGPAKYPIREFILDTDDLPIDSNSAGRYRCYIKMYRNPELDCKSLQSLLCLTMKLLIDME